MKYIALFLAFLTLLSCRQHPTPHRVHSIALQPIGPCDGDHLLFLQQEVHAFFHKPVVVLPTIAMPVQFLNTSKGERYSGDSIIKWLSHTMPDSISYIAGFTHKDIFTTIPGANGQVKEPAYKYAVWGIFGLGYRPGRSSITSDYRLSTNNIQKFQHRLRTVVIHELGHNMGLPHCPNTHCIMNDANESIKTVDNSADNYCDECNKRIKPLLIS